MRWGFIGIGRVTHRMVEAVRAAGHQVAWGAGRDPHKLAQWQQRFNVPNVSTDFREVIVSETVDAIYVALPPSLHATWAIAALEHGKRVLCEKALASDEAQANLILAAVLRTGIPLVDATAFPHHPRSHAMRQVIVSGELGEICRVTVACSVANILDRKDHRSNAELGGGCLLDLGWYCAYATLWFTGLRPTQFLSHGTRVDSRPDSAWYQVQTVARLEEGEGGARKRLERVKAHRSAVASWDCGYEAAGRKWIEIAGTQASVICDDFLRPWDNEKPRFWVHGSDLQGNGGKARSELVGVGVFQESNLVKHTAEVGFEESLEGLTLAMETQRILAQIDREVSR